MDGWGIGVEREELNDKKIYKHNLKLRLNEKADKGQFRLPIQ